MTERCWTLRDDNRQHHHGVIPLNQPQITLTLRWKADRAGVVSEVGRYRTDLPALVKARYSRISASGRYFLRFQRTGERIEVALNRRSSSLGVASRLNGNWKAMNG